LGACQDLLKAFDLVAYFLHLCACGDDLADLAVELIQRIGGGLQALGKGGVAFLERILKDISSAVGGGSDGFQLLLQRGDGAGLLGKFFPGAGYKRKEKNQQQDKQNDYYDQQNRFHN
jgi:hypothetical protein